MIFGVLESAGRVDLPSEPLLRGHAISTAEALLADFVAGSCDWALIDEDVPNSDELAREIGFVCDDRPLSGVCAMRRGRGVELSIRAAGAGVAPWSARGLPEFSSLGTIRRLWQGAWGRVIARQVLGGHCCDPLLHGVVERCFSIALGASRPSDVAADRKSVV